MCVCHGVHGRSKDNSVELTFFFHLYMGSNNQILVASLAQQATLPVEQSHWPPDFGYCCCYYCCCKDYDLFSHLVTEVGLCSANVLNGISLNVVN